MWADSQETVAVPATSFVLSWLSLHPCCSLENSKNKLWAKHHPGCGQAEKRGPVPSIKEAQLGRHRQVNRTELCVREKFQEGESRSRYSPSLTECAESCRCGCPKDSAQPEEGARAQLPGEKKRHSASSFSPSFLAINLLSWDSVGPTL
jgi:hypothetical protein